jgi:DNA polymerase III epsilon subunit-like protein
LEELEKDRVIKRINEIKEEIGQLSPSSTAQPEEPEATDKEIEEAVQEVIDEAEAKDESVPYQGLLERIKNKLIERGNKRFGIESLEAVQDAIIDITKDPEKAYDLAGLIRNYQLKRDRKDGAAKNPLNLTREEMIKRLMWFKFGAGAIKNESNRVRQDMKDYEKDLESLSNEDMIAMLELIYDEMDAKVAQENEEKQRRNDVAEARAKKRREREDKLLNEGNEEEDASGRKRLTKEERPTGRGKEGDLSPGGDWVYVEAEPGNSASREGWFASDQLNAKYEKYGYDVSKWPEFEEEEEPKAEPAPAPSEAPLPPLPADVKVTVKALVDKRRKIQRKIDKADLDETTTAAKRKALKDELDDVTRIIDSLVMGTKPAEAPATPATPEAEAPATPEATAPASPAQLVKGVQTDQLKPGDVLVDGHFTVTDIKREGTKKVRVDGVTQEIPSYRVSGYFPNSVEQSSKVWSENHISDLYRGATPPAKGDLPELNQPKAEDYGSEYVWPNVTKVTYGKRTLYAPKNKELEAKFLEDYAVYDAERLRRMALWEAPAISKENNDATNSPITPTNTIYVENVPASDVKVGDIAFRKNKLGAGEFFVVTKVVGTKDGMATLEGHYVGHQTQTKEWREGTLIDVIRGEKNLPAAGDKEPLDRPDKADPNYSTLEKERKAKIAEADKGYTPDFPTKTAEQGITPLTSKPQLPAFYGTAEELLALGDGPAILEALNASENGYVVFDFETIGKDVQNSLDPDAPIQVAAVKYVKGEKVGELNLYINPGEPLGNFYYETDADGKRVLKTDRVRDSEGNPVTDEWLATQPELKEQLQKLVDFFGPDAIIVGQNNSFDINILERFSEKLGIDFKLSGAIDTLGIARALQKIEFASITLPENPSEGDEVTSSEGNVWKFEDKKWKQSNKLADLAARLGIPATKEDKFHDALFDVEVTEKVLRALLSKMKAGEVPAGGSKTYDSKYSAWLDSREKRKKELADIAIANAWSGNVSSNDELIANVTDSLDEKVSSVDGEEEVLTPKTHTSKVFGDTITTDWVLDPENTDFIENAIVQDLILGDFMVGRDGQLYEVIGFADDDKDPANAQKVIRTGIEDQVTLDSRDMTNNTRKDGGSGFFLRGKLEGGIYRRKENAGKTTPEVRRDLNDPNEVFPKAVDLVPDVEPVKGEPLTEDQIDNVAGQAIAEIVALSKPQDADETVPVKTIEETVPDLNLDSSIKEQVLESRKPGEPSAAHLSADGVPLAEGDEVVNVKNGRKGRASTFYDLYQKKYTNYLKVRYEDSGDREPVSAKSLTLIKRPTELKVKGEDTVTDVVAKIKDLQGDTPVEGAPSPEELAERFKAAQAARDEKAKELNLVQTSTGIVNKIKENTPLRESTNGEVPSLKTGELPDVTFAFDKPTVKEVGDLEDILGVGPEDIVIFNASPQMVLRNEAIAAIKPDGTITWKNEETKRKKSVELERVLQKFNSPVINVSAMAIMPKPDPIEQEDFGNGTLTGTPESTFDYDTISTFPPTEEQIAVVDAVMEGKDVVVQALAGSGKTATLVLAARRLLRQRPDKKLLYIVFNKETAEEAQGRMPENVDSRTMDNIVASMMPTWVRDRIKLNAGKLYFGKDGKAKEKRYKELQKIIKENAKNNREMSPEDKKEYGELLASTRKYIPYGDLVNLFDYYKFEQVTVSIRGTETNWGAQDLVKELRDVVDKFAISKDDVISEKHFVKLDEKTRKVVAYYDSVPKILIDYANRMWDDLSSDEGWDPTSPNISRVDFSHLLKRWALTSPQFIDGLNSGSTSNGTFKNRVNDMFFFDEAQDMNPVIVKLLDDQKGIQKVYVGDSNQAIYAFRGAVDELGNVKDAVELYLTRTFRFGDVIAGIGNRFLTLLKSPKKIVGKPGEDFGKIVENMEDPDAYIARTNAAIVAGIFEYI